MFGGFQREFSATVGNAVPDAGEELVDTSQTFTLESAGSGVQRGEPGSCHEASVADCFWDNYHGNGYISPERM
jgi:hypothetical protein